jgi:acetylornithine deacetylase/succinyl-diaminopimelate desuccinylase-like protein
MAHVEAIARAPHPPGSPDHDRVRDSIRGEFAKLGLQTEVQAGIGRRPLRHREGSVENILARLPETANTRPLMLACHYDSVPMGPGPATMRTPWRS